MVQSGLQSDLSFEELYRTEQRASKCVSEGNESNRAVISVKEMRLGAK